MDGTMMGLRQREWQWRAGAFAVLASLALMPVAPRATASPVVEEALPTIAGEPSRTATSKSATAFVEPAWATASVRRIELAAADVALEDAGSKGARPQPTQIGGARLVDPREGRIRGADLDWRPANGGFVAAAAIRSPGAAALRVALAAPAASGLRIRVGGTDGGVAGPFAGEDLESATRAGGAYWTPVTRGEEQRIELFAPDAASAARLALRVDSVSHLVADPVSPRAAMAKASSSGSCNQDVACLSQPSAALLEASRSVAKIVYTSRGNTYTCSATLVNDRDKASQVPYLLTAAHCIGSREVAATVTSYWFYEKVACGGDAPEPVVLNGGATLLFANTTSDVAMIRLNEPAPAGAYFAGLDPNPVPVGANVVALHHPRGDVKKVSSGVAVQAPADTAARYTTVAWLVGDTEPGSSGSGAFVQQGGAYVVRGMLLGGSSSCETTGTIANPANRDYFNRVDADFATIGEWLLADAAPLADYADLWRDPDDPGWGLSIVRQAGSAIAAVWFTHDAEGEPVWAWIADGRWTSTTAYEAPVYLSSVRPDPRAGESRAQMTVAGNAVLAFEAKDRARFTVRLDGVTRTWSLKRAAS